MHPIDITIIISYLLVVLIIGLVLSKIASRNINEYFLGGNNIPFYLLGIANATGMFDITGTMWMVTIFVIYGLKSVFIPWLWPCFNQIFLMIYLAGWLRRSQVMTGAEWITIRFGQGRGATLSHISVVIFALVGVIGFLAYAFQGIGKFAAVFFPWDIHPHIYALILMGITTLYVIAGGMYSVVITDLVQFVILTVSAIFVAGIAMLRTSPTDITSSVPPGWENLFFGWKLNLDWSGLLNAANNKIETDGYNLFTVFMMLVLFKGILASMAGPAPNYDMQRILATRSPREAGLMSGFTSVALFFPRYLLIGAIGVLGIVFFRDHLNEMGDKVDFEQIMPYVINHFIPTGLMGFILAGLLAAFMSTFDCTVNSGASYIVKDIYQRYVNPQASSKSLVWFSYLSSILVVIVGICFGFMTKSINDILQWIVAGLYGGYIAPNVLKWYWWRFNGAGYFAGMITGIAAALVFPKLLPDMLPLNTFPIILTLSGLVSIITTLLTKPQNMSVLQSFYLKTRPWGWWQPVIQSLRAEGVVFDTNRNAWRDWINIIVGIIWQVCLCVLPIYLILRNWQGFALTSIVLIASSIFLKSNWYDKLATEPVCEAQNPTTKN